MKVTAILASLALMLTLVACGGDPSATATPEPTPTATSPPIPTATPGPGLTPASVPVASPTPTPTPTHVPVPTATPQPTPTATATPTLTPTPTRTPRPTATPTPTQTPTPTTTPTTPPTVTPTPTRITADNPDSLPPFPNIYSGRVLVGGQSARDGTSIFARIGNARIGIYQSASVTVVDGRYSQLTTGPESVFFYGLTITFHAVVNGLELQAAETAIFRAVILGRFLPPQYLFNTLDLSFPSPYAK